MCIKYEICYMVIFMDEWGLWSNEINYMYM